MRLVNTAVCGAELLQSRAVGWLSDAHGVALVRIPPTMRRWRSCGGS